ncbi:MAG: hypothetical protein HY290_00565 [Planctomycetia bacterium]|nr:hypothetical protein [Planctomycetia bacterium]
MRIRGIPLTSLPGLLKPRTWHPDRETHLFLCVCDHYEPMWRRPARHVQDARVARWVDDFPRVTAGLHDSAGRPPQHTFFYPQDEYDAEHVEQIAGLCRLGYGDVDVHLHHRHDTSGGLRDKLETYVRTLHDRHGLLERGRPGQITYGFIHGNWALDNSHPCGDWCGVNDEITILRETGCYADFTMPAAPDPCQTKTINSIYYAVDDPRQPKSHDTGIAARVGRKAPDDSLLMIQGPLAFDWSSRKLGLFPRLENGDLTGRRPATLQRLNLWASAGVAVAGREDWRFIKLHTHGAQEANLEMFLGEPMRRFHEGLRQLADEHPQLKYYYVTAREMADLVHQAELGEAVPRFSSDRFDSAERAESCSTCRCAPGAVPVAVGAHAAISGV